MSYLDGVRLTFSGKFQVNVSTVNNDAGHFDTGRFQPSYQQMQTESALNGWFNPQGDAAFRLLGCHVTGATTGGHGKPDPVLGCTVGDADARVCGKMVDLDPQQQLVSEIWGLQVRITDGHGQTWLAGDLETVAFMDIWDRATGGGDGGDMNAGAVYQSVLRNLVWGDVSTSPVLTALAAAAKASGLLSIKFNVDGVNADFTAADFMCGRIVGTIGPATATEPHHLVLGRQFMATAAPHGNFFKPVGLLNFFPARLDEAGHVLYLDLGNAISTTSPAGPLSDVGDLVVTADGVTLGTVVAKGAHGYAGDPTWYARTAGIVALPLTAAQVTAAAAAPITVASSAGASIAESPTGAFLRADRYVYRMSPGDVVQIPVYATRWGKPLVGAGVTYVVDNDQLQCGSSCQPDDCPAPGTSATDPGPAFGATAPTDDHGVAILHVTANDPGHARTFTDGATIDGQVYGIRPGFTDVALAGPPAQINQWNFVSFLVFSGFTPPHRITWDVVQPILQQYANLYPIMLRFLDLGDYASVVAHTRLLELAFGLDVGNPNSMPVTRDLSPARRKAIMAFLKEPLPAATGADLIAAPPRATAPRPRAPALATLTSPKGGKAAAAARRLHVHAHALAAPTAATAPTRHPVRLRLAIAAHATGVDAVRALLQQAVELEHATVPLYLYALYSLDAAKNGEIARIIRSVVIEEMLHMTLASNVLNALGGRPQIDQPAFIPTYPGPLPGGVETDLTVHLRPFSMAQLQTFIDLEQPASPLVFPTVAGVAGQVTIGEFYQEIMNRIVALGDGAFVPGPHNQIGPDQMRDAVVVTDVASALRAIQIIVEQGEGTSSTPKEVVGARYAHYYRFMQIQKGRHLIKVADTGPVEQQYAYQGPPIVFDPTGVYAVAADPTAASYPAGSQLRAFNDRFNYTYTALLRSLHATLNGAPHQLDTAIGLMMSLEGLARDMMAGAPNPAVLTGPSFQYLPSDPAPR